MKYNNKTNMKYFHCYATANDSRFYIKDLRNLRRLKATDSGLDEIRLLVAISKVKRVNLFDKLFVTVVKKMFRNHESVKLIDIFHKTNVGRDFSSYQILLNKVRTTAADEDYVLFQNRSGYGPFHNNWYKKSIVQFEKFESVAMCGSTINFLDHPQRSSRNNLPHIQTYAFLSKMSFLNMLGENFPGADETVRLDIITKGEIGLSQFFLERDYKITCMEWPDEAISNQSQPPANLDVKDNVKAVHHFYHRRYFKKRRRKVKKAYRSIVRIFSAK